jgi:hypothetical protein
MYLVCSIRTNLVFVVIFFLLDVAVFLLTGAYWKASSGDVVAFEKLSIVRQLGSSSNKITANKPQ